MNRILIHIGYHKTATTWLQKNLFNNADIGFISPYQREKITIDLIKPDGLTFLPSHVRSLYNQDIEKSWENNLVPVISHERLSGYPATGGYDSKHIADTLLSVFPDARILIVIRNQTDVLGSWYKEYIFDGGCQSYKDFFLKRDKRDFIVRAPQFRFEYYEYDRLIGYYQKIFSPENVLVLPFERLKKEPYAFTPEILNFVDITRSNEFHAQKENVGKSMSEVSVTRALNRLFYYNQLNLNPLIPSTFISEQIPKISRHVSRFCKPFNNKSEREFKHFIKTISKDRFRESNRRTIDITGLDLYNYGYDC